ncbi:hypothetical protein ED733_006863 [Metarhizium rileyi]|uniref:SH3 domain-containing protein n=1 Tax=Metarhizium rileyi (strain RCEF 4871) TaxID=1649241 RepID=A0A5C6GJE9_METRR|nr:hypothetical protein ED733_006863 [Metarhizium rileyi]
MHHLHHRHRHESRDILDDMDDFFSNSFEDNDKGVTPRDTDEGNGPTLIRTIYKTMAPTFEGPVAGYSTIREHASSMPSEIINPSAKEDPTPAKSSTPTIPTKSKPKETPSIQSVISRPSSSSSASQTILLKDTGILTPAPTDHYGAQFTSTPTLNLATSRPTTDSMPSQEASDGTSAGAKAGIAFGVLGGVLIVGLVAFLLFNRRRRQAATQREANNEKSRPNASGNANTFGAMNVQSDHRAPRISLRPVTQFLPNWSLDKRSSKGAGMALHSAAAGANSHNTLWERPATSQSSHPANPFGNQAERVHEPNLDQQRALSRSDPFTANGPAIAAGATAGAGVGLTRKASMRNHTQRNVDLTLPPTLGFIPPSPAGTEFSMSPVSPGATVPPSNGAAAIAAAGGPPNSNVHRVQLDFKPSLDDEMELKAGDLVRLLHEYDDGWALVIRLDRSQQGVVPRTCLSTRPVKPRAPQGGSRLGPPVNPSGQHSLIANQPQSPGQRPMTPQGRPMTPQGRPMTPQGMASQTRPRMSPGAPSPQSMSPTVHPQSPGPGHNAPPVLPAYSESRSASPGGIIQPMRSPGPRPVKSVQSPPPGPPNKPPTGPIGRKPVPGQAY